jgi:hypothetical protein
MRPLALSRPTRRSCSVRVPRSRIAAAGSQRQDRSRVAMLPCIDRECLASSDRKSHCRAWKAAQAGAMLGNFRCPLGFNEWMTGLFAAP